MAIRSLFKKDVRLNIRAAAVWSVKSKTRGFPWHYMQLRPMMIGMKFPKYIDCSGHFTWCYRAAGAADPNKRGYNGVGNTETLMACGKEVQFKDLQIGDSVIYNPNLDITKQHVGIVVELAATAGDVLTVSMGQEGDPSYVKVKEDGRPFKFYTYPTTQKYKAYNLPPLKA